jgi:hypothetical protein
MEIPAKQRAHVSVVRYGVALTMAFVQSPLAKHDCSKEKT